VQANIKAMLTTDEAALNQVYNIAAGSGTSMEKAFEILTEINNKI